MNCLANLAFLSASSHFVAVNWFAVKSLILPKMDGSPCFGEEVTSMLLLVQLNCISANALARKNILRQDGPKLVAFHVIWLVSCLFLSVESIKQADGPMLPEGLHSPFQGSVRAVILGLIHSAPMKCQGNERTGHIDTLATSEKESPHRTQFLRPIGCLELVEQGLIDVWLILHGWHCWLCSFSVLRQHTTLSKPGLQSTPYIGKRERRIAVARVLQGLSQESSLALSAGERSEE